jgi:hypothetical protein
VVLVVVVTAADEAATVVPDTRDVKSVAEDESFRLAEALVVSAGIIVVRYSVCVHSGSDFSSNRMLRSAQHTGKVFEGGNVGSVRPG